MPGDGLELDEARYQARLQGQTLDLTAVLPDRELIHAVYSVSYKFEW